MKAMHKKTTLLLSTLFLSCASFSQLATLKEEVISLDTYGFHTPNPVPVLTHNPKISPYFTFEGYEHTSVKKNWKVITLENDYIKVFILPEIGGKVWGAIEKSTGEEFLYKNKVVKFRNIAMRGPWTSGGIEFNFGIIGHHPMTATPVDYKTRKNQDGSVSCIVGALDLPSRTNWEVEIRLGKDKAYFETHASWHNGTAVNQSYYNWMTGAAAASDDLEFFIPGTMYLGHNGDARSWPMDEKGRNLALYRENNFGPAKSYHIVGDHKDFFGGYYHTKNFGFGHWSPYEEMPGQKLWLWALSRSGAIWEELLTDKDGQYIEFQAGRLFNQYSPGETNPISQANFDPYTMDRWTEIWFPYKEIGGMVAVSKDAVLNVKEDKGTTYIGLNALSSIDDTLKVYRNGKMVLSQDLQLKPMDVYATHIPSTTNDKMEVVLEKTDLKYTNDPKVSRLKRPFKAEENVQFSENQQHFFEGWEALKFREYDTAEVKIKRVLQADPSHLEGLVKMAELDYRRTDYKAGLEHAQKALQLDTYHSGANYMAALNYRSLNDLINALESLGWAARDIKFRSVAYTLMSEIYMGLEDFKKAESYASKALSYNSYNLNAHHVLLLVHRKRGNLKAFTAQMEALAKIAALNHFAAFESVQMHNGVPIAILENIQNEFKDETVLELAFKYLSLNDRESTLRLLNLFPNNAKIKLLAAYLFKDIDVDSSQSHLQEVLKISPDFVFPYRREMAPILEWALTQNTHWKLRYYLAQNYIALGQHQKGKTLLESCGQQPDNDTFYRFRAAIVKERSFEDRLLDFKKALSLKPVVWKSWDELIRFYFQNNKFKEAHGIAEKAYKKFSDNYTIGLSYAKTLVAVEQYEKCITLLKSLQVLPYEHASESKVIYDNAHLFLAQQSIERQQYPKAIKLLKDSKEWPEHLGVGQPYDPDTRLQDYLLAHCYSATGNNDASNQALETIVGYSEKNPERIGFNSLFNLMALKQLNRWQSLEQQMEQLEENQHIKEVQAVLALFKKDQKLEEIAKKESHIDDRLWHIMHFATTRY